MPEISSSPPFFNSIFRQLIVPQSPNDKVKNSVFEEAVGFFLAERIPIVISSEIVF